MTFPASWQRKCRVRLNKNDVVIGAGHVGPLAWITEAWFQTYAQEAITDGGTFAMQSDGGDFRLSYDEFGLVPCPIHLRAITLNANPSLSQIRAVFPCPQLDSGGIAYVWAWWLPVSPESQPAVGDPYGRNATYAEYACYYSFEQDLSVGAPQLTDLTGNGYDLTRSQAIGNYTVADVPTGKAVNMDAGGAAFNGPAPGLVNSSFTISQWFETLSTDTGDGPGWTLTKTGVGFVAYLKHTSNSWTSYYGDFGLGSHSEPAGKFNFSMRMPYGSSEEVVYNDTSSVPGHTNAITDWDTQEFQCNFGSYIGEMYIVNDAAFSFNRLRTEKAIKADPDNFGECDTPVASVVQAVVRLNAYANCNCRIWKDASGVPGAEIDGIANTVDGDNDLSVPIPTASVDAHISLVREGSHPIVFPVAVTTAGLVLPRALLAEDPTFKASLADTYTLGVDFDVTTLGAVSLADVVDGRAWYCSLVRTWQQSATLPGQKPFGLRAQNPRYYRFNRGWDFDGATSRNRLQGAGYDVVDASNVIQQVYVGERSLGLHTGATAYYSLGGGAATQANTANEFDHVVQVYQISSFDNRNDDLKLFVRYWGYYYKYSSALGNGADLTEPDAHPHALAIDPLKDADPNIVDTPAYIDANAPYTGMGVTVYAYNAASPSLVAWAISTLYVEGDVVQSSGGRWFICASVSGTSAGDDSDLAGGSDTGVSWDVYPGEREVTTGNWYAFGEAIDGNSGTPKQVHSFAQRRLLYDGADNLRETQYGDFENGVYTTATGVYVDGLAGNAVFTDLTGTPRTPPTTALLTLEGLVAGSEVRAFVGSNPLTAVEIAANESTGTSWSFSHTEGGNAGYIHVFHANYKFLKISLTYSSDDATLPAVSQPTDTGYLNPP